MAHCDCVHRYGYRPIPSEIDTAELELLREALVSMGNDVHLMDKWYRKDNNKVGREVVHICFDQPADPARVDPAADHHPPLPLP